MPATSHSERKAELFCRMKNTLIIENCRISLNSIRSHLLRTILTILIIAFGIMALVGILTATDSIKYSLTKNFSMMGSSTFTIRNRTLQVHMGNGPNEQKLYEAISYKQAMEFKEKFFFPGYTSVFIGATGVATIKYKSNKTNPNVYVMGTDEIPVDGLNSGNRHGRVASGLDFPTQGKLIVFELNYQMRVRGGRGFEGFFCNALHRR